MKNKGMILAVVILAVLMISAPLVAGQNLMTPRVLKGTWASETVSLTFEGKDGAVAVCDGVTTEGTYINGTTGTKLVIWFDFGEDCPETLNFLKSSRQDYLVYATGEDDRGDYMQIDGVKYYRQS